MNESEPITSSKKTKSPSLHCAPVGALCALLLAGCTGIPAGVEPVQSFDASRYVGTWYEIMRLDHRFERNLVDVTATYTLNSDGSVAVVNRGYDTKACRWKEIDGRAVFQGAPDVARLSVTFFWPFAGGYHVFALDKSDYAWAVVAGPTRRYLWILARTPDLPSGTRHHLVEKARSLGFPVEHLILVEHGKPECAD